ncbi:T9SS type A sorting domain-containing protein [candidate division WOR-3 bacterium]|nr:T9SS type A sorting domain-containing protein [candidate division WOR-3 bacterium]
MTELGPVNSGRVPRLLNIAGRAVLALKPGENDVRHLPAGVYFLRMANGEGRAANSRVVITR